MHEVATFLLKTSPGPKILYSPPSAFSSGIFLHELSLPLLCLQPLPVTWSFPSTYKTAYTPLYFLKTKPFFDSVSFKLPLSLLPIKDRTLKLVFTDYLHFLHLFTPIPLTSLQFCCPCTWRKKSQTTSLMLSLEISLFEVQFTSVQLLSCVWLFATPWIAACQVTLSITNSRSLLKLLPIESVMPFSHLILCHPLLFLPPIPPSIRVFSNQSTIRMRWPKYWSFSFSISPSNEHPGLISFRMDWLDLLAVQVTKDIISKSNGYFSILILLASPTVNFYYWQPTCSQNSLFSWFL